MEQIRVVHEDQADWEHWPNIPGVRWRTLFSRDRTQTRGLTLGLVEIEPHCQWPLHSHQETEIYSILQGEGNLLTANGTRAVSPGTALHIPKDALHGVENTGDQVLRILYVFEADSFKDIGYSFPDSARSP